MDSSTKNDMAIAIYKQAEREVLANTVKFIAQEVVTAIAVCIATTAGIWYVWLTLNWYFSS